MYDKISHASIARRQREFMMREEQNKVKTDINRQIQVRPQGEAQKHTEGWGYLPLAQYLARLHSGRSGNPNRKAGQLMLMACLPDARIPLTHPVRDVLAEVGDNGSE